MKNSEFNTYEQKIARVLLNAKRRISIKEMSEITGFSWQVCKTNLESLKTKAPIKHEYLGNRSYWYLNDPEIKRPKPRYLKKENPKKKTFSSDELEKCGEIVEKYNDLFKSETFGKSEIKTLQNLIVEIDKIIGSRTKFFLTLLITNRSKNKVLLDKEIESYFKNMESKNGN